MPSTSSHGMHSESINKRIEEHSAHWFIKGPSQAPHVGWHTELSVNLTITIRGLRVLQERTPTAADMRTRISLQRVA